MRFWRGIGWDVRLRFCTVLVRLALNTYYAFTPRLLRKYFITRELTTWMDGVTETDESLRVEHASSKLLRSVLRCSAPCSVLRALWPQRRSSPPLLRAPLLCSEPPCRCSVPQRRNSAPLLRAPLLRARASVPQQRNSAPLLRCSVALGAAA